MIYQGDQLHVPFLVKVGKEIINDSDLYIVRISVNNVIQSSDDIDETRRLNCIDNQWMYYLDANTTKKMSGSVPCQVSVQNKADNTIQHSPIFSLEIAKSVASLIAGG